MCHDHQHPHTHEAHDHQHPHPTGTRQITRRHMLRISALGIASALIGACSTSAHSQEIAAQQKVYLPTIVVPDAISLPGFASFRDQVTLAAEGNYYRIASNGMPTHPMMIGIQSWQQQVPLPQSYRGSNAWSLPINPVLADQPISARTGLYRGAIALAVNGVPIFNALNNRGDDAYLAGELDNWGGHAGRADDYHYHVAPLHLQATVGIDQPIAYALDGFALYGLTEPDGSVVTGLDAYNGHFDSSGRYHYHATLTYPYINGGLRGVVQVQADQIEPQPRTTPIRPSLTPLSGAQITNFTVISSSSYSLEYTISGLKNYVNYSFVSNTYTFEFIDSTGAQRREVYTLQ